MPEVQITHIPLNILFPSPTNPRKTFPEAEIIALAENIQEHGQFVPLNVRKISNVKDEESLLSQYEIIAGERRWRAQKIIHHNNDLPPRIPCIIMEITNEQVIMMQMAENLARQDLSPLEEAYSYRLALDNTAYATVELLAPQVGKSAYHVASRLKLLDLQGPALERYKAGTLPLSHALEIARLTPADQDRVEGMIGEQGTAGVRSLEKLREIINTQVLLNLFSAPFPKDDAMLHPEAGACNSCPKRSGSNSLFADIVNQDVCFDGACFQVKKNLAMIVQLGMILNERPDVLIFQFDAYDLPPDNILIYLTGQRATITRTQDGYVDAKESEPGARVAFAINGPYASQYFYVKAKKGKPGKNAPQQSVEPIPDEKPVTTTEEQVADLQTRIIRNGEIRDDKYFANLLVMFEASPAFNKSEKPPNKAEKAAMAFLLFDELTMEAREAMGEEPITDLDTLSPEELYATFVGMDSSSITVFIRKLLHQKFKRYKPTNSRGYFLLKVMESCFTDADRKAVWQPATDEMLLKNENIKKRIKTLQKPSKKGSKKKA